MPSFESFVQVLLTRAEEDPARRVFTYLEDGERAETCVTYADLDAKARAVAAMLQATCAPGARIVLLYPPGIDYVAAFFGCLYGGFVAVPAYPPDPSRLNRTLPRLHAIVSDARAEIVLTTSMIAGMAEMLAATAPDLARLRWIATDTIDLGQGADWKPTLASAETLAFLQYTSGSTGTPKGVMLTHGNLIANERSIQSLFKLDRDESVGVGWLPLYHDMGLIGNVLQTVYVGFHCVLMSPLDFLQRPLRWLEAISRYGGTVSGGPNFAYDLCVRKISPEDRAKLDLRSWKLAFCGAEPVRRASLDRFAETFAECGFRRDSFLPCYGLAEATLMVSGKSMGTDYRVERLDVKALEQGTAVVARAEDTAREIVSCGEVGGGSGVLVVDPETRHPMPPGSVGEVWVAGPHVAVGYWGDAAKTAEVFGAELAPAPPGGRPAAGYLRTGDLAFVHQGELFICGRLKDLIIVRGKNYYPQDIERAAEASARAIRQGGAAAFSLHIAGEERVVLVAELVRVEGLDAETVFDAVRSGVSEDSALHLHAVVLVRPGSIPKTSSGKIQRHAAKAAYLESSLDVVVSSAGHEDKAASGEAAEAPGEAPDLAPLGLADLEAAAEASRRELVERYLRAEIARVLRADPSKVDLGAPLGSLGLDSLMAVDVTHAIERSLGVVLPATALLREGTGRALAAKIVSLVGTQTREQEPLVAEAEAGAGSAAEFPLSAGQEALWFLQNLTGETSAYNVGTAFSVRGELDVEALAASLRVLLEDNEALTATFAVTGAGLVQRTDRALARAFRVELVDASGLDDEAVHRLVGDEVYRPFDLERGPVFRATVLSRGPGWHVLVLAAHHIAADLWSLVILLSELRAVYPAIRAGKPAPALPARAPYRDFVAWQGSYLGREAETEWAYWRAQLEGVPHLELPTDRPRPAVQTYGGAAAPIELSPELVARASELARSEGTTLFVVLLACFEVLLARTSGQESFLVGSPAAGRPRASFERTVGYFVNPVPLRADLAGDPTGRALLGRVREGVLAGLEHQSFPFPRAVERLSPTRDPSRSPLFQALFVLEKAYLEDVADLTMLALGARTAHVDFAGLDVGPFPVGKRTERFDLTLSLAHGEGRLGGALEYNTSLFEPATAAAMASHFVTLLEAMVAAPDEIVWRLPMMSAEERARLSVLWRGQPAPAEEATVHALFESVAARTPAALAVAQKAEELSYAELNRRANQLARLLRKDHGVAVESRVVTCFERSPAMIVADLAVMKAGGAFVPIDPNYPRARAELVAEDAGAVAVLTTRDIADRLRTEGAFASGPPVLAIDDPGFVARLLREEGTDGRWPVHPRSPAYVVYTSGTTGKPKGVVIEHTQLVAMSRWVERHYDLVPEDRLSQTAGPAFDASVFEIVPPLLVGASLHIVDDETRRSAEALRALLVDLGITICFAPTPLAEQLLAETDWKASKLRYLLSGGDRLTRRPEARHPFVLINGYGPSECTVQSTVAAVGRSDGGRAPTIGKPIDGVHVYVLDARLEPLPIGVPGELFVGGGNVGRGYGGRPALTAERFVPDPFSKEAGARMYRTGDLARFLPSGELEFIGRVDHQVKIHGHRIELGEIESVLVRQAGVREAVVLAREDAPGRKRLVAYVTARDPAAPPDAGVLAARLRSELPEYMVPVAIIALAALPLTHNGKVDRSALPAPLPGSPDGDGEAPRDALEDHLCKLAAEVLGLPKFGVAEKFFEAGGSSLDLVKLQKRIQAELGLRVPLPSFFEYPSIGALAPHVRTLQVEKERGLGVEASVAARAPEAAAPARRDASTPIAIIGMAGRFPGAASVHELWDNVLAGRDCLARFDASEARLSPLMPEGPSHPNFLGAEGVLAATGTDPELWRPAADTRGLDLQSRLFLDTVLAAFEDAGHDPWSCAGRVSVYGGASPLPLVEALAQAGLGTRGSALWALGTVAPDTLPMRVAHTFGFRGEAMNVNTACSTGLAVVHLACQSLLGGNSDLAVAVAANVPTVQGIGYVHEEGTILSKDGVVRPFDADASGVVLGRGVAAVLLKPLDAALRDGDAVYAVIRATATNNDGRGKVGYTAPGVEGQVEVIAAAHALAHVSAREVDYVETHGTGTRLGDPVELSALTRAFRRSTDEVGYCALGALKANIGHLDTVAGLAGLVKTALALHHETVPPLAHFTTPNPDLRLETTPFTVPTEARSWKRGPRPRIAGVSSFGIGGTNVHAVVEEAPARSRSTLPARRHVVLEIGARTGAALELLAGEVAARVEHASLEEACDLAYTLNTRRLKWPHRRAVVGVDGPSLARALRDEPRPVTGGKAARGIAFVFAGMGSNPAGIGRELYEQEASFREHVDACQAVLLPEGLDVRDALTRREPGTPLPVGLAAAALFTFETALVRLLAGWGIKPTAMVGHSFGEYAALFSAGGIGLAAALEVVRVRCRVMDAMPEGAMLVATCNEADAPALAHEADVEIAALNGPKGSVFSGPPVNIARLQANLRARRIATVKLGVDRALHSQDVEPGLPLVAAAFDGAAIRTPETTFVSTVTGAQETERLASGAYWAEQMRRPVRFAEALRTAQAAGADMFVEIGPSGGLVPVMSAVLGAEAACQPTLQGTADARSLYALVARLLEHQVELDWTAWYVAERRGRVPAPLHPRPAPEVVSAGRSVPAATTAETPRQPEMPPARQPQPEARQPEMPPAPPAAIAGSGEASIEARVSELWKRALNLEAIDPRAHFLELGGSSLVAVQLVANMREEFRVDIGLAEVFAAPTVEELARLIATKLPETRAAVTAPVAVAPPFVDAPAAPRASVAPSTLASGVLSAPGADVLSAVQKRVLAADDDPHWPASVLNMAGAVRLRGPLDVQRLARALRDVVRRHEALHTRLIRSGAQLSIDPRFRASDVQLASVWCDAEGTEARLAEVRAALAERIEHRFDLTREIPLRAFLFEIAEGDHVLGLVVHHMAMDAPSLKILLQDTLASYLGVPLGAEGPSYAGFAARQALEIATEGAAHAAWLRARIDASPRLRALLSAEGAGARRADATISFELGPDVGRAVAELKKKRGVSTFVALASAVGLALGEAFKSRELIVSTPYGNRERAEHAGLVGYVAHCMVMPLDLERGAKAADGVVGEVGRAFAEALGHATVPFEHAVLAGERGVGLASGAQPFSDVCLVVHEELEQSARLGELVVDPFSHERPGHEQPPVWAATMGTIGFLVHWRPDGSGGRVTFCYPRALLPDAAADVPRRVMRALETLAGAPGALVPSAGAGAGAVAGITPMQAAPRSPLALRIDGVALSRADLEAAVETVLAALRSSPLPARAVVDIVARNRAELVVCALAVLRAGASATIGRADTPFVLTTAEPAEPTEAAGSARRELWAPLDIPAGRARSARADQSAAPIGNDAVEAAAVRIRTASGATEAGTTAAHIVWDEALPDNRALPFALAALGGEGLVSELTVVAPSVRSVTETLPLSLAYFPVDEERYGDDTYRLLLEGAKVGDDAGLRGLFVPERHFHPFGGTFPDPLVAAAALATVTKRIQLRAGSIVLPLHDPLRVAESWAMVDVLSGGRVGLSIATGWRAEDFVLAPGRYARRKEELEGLLETLRALWRGESIERPDPQGRPVRLRTRPRPVQPEIPVWLTCASSPASFSLAGELGTAVFTMVASDLDGLRDNIAEYRRSFAKHWNGATGHVTILASTFLHEDGRAREIALPALERYMGFSLDIGMKESGKRMAVEAQRRFLRQKAERVADHDGLVGDMEEGRKRVARLAEAGADEVACLIDFGVPHEEAIRGISRIAELAARAPALSRRWPRLPAPVPLEHRGLHEVWLVASSSSDAVTTSPHRTVLVEDAELPAVVASCIDEQPLSAIQFGVYFDELRFARATYNNPFLVRSAGRLDPDRLELAIAAACRRHDMLRSRFVHRQDRVVRVVDLEPIVDLRVEPEAVDEEAVVLLARRDSAERFALDRGHPLRAHLYGAKDGGSYLMLCVHHIAGDVVSGFIALRDVMRAYQALPGDAFAGEAPPPSYAEVLDAREAGSKDRDKRLARWVAQVEGVKPVLAWPSSGTRPARLSGEGAELARLLPKARVDVLRQAAARSRVTVPTFLFSVLQALLHLKTRRRDLLVGSVTLGRSNPAWLEVVGPFFNMLPVRSSLEPGQTFAKLAQRTAASLMEAMTEDEIGVAEIVQRAKTPTTLDRSPLVQFLFNYIPKQGVGDGGDSGISQIDVDWGIATFDVDVTARERGEDLLLSVKYSKDALDEAEAAGLLLAFERLVARVTDEPGLVLLPADAPLAARDSASFWSTELAGATRGVSLPTEDSGAAPPSGDRDRGVVTGRSTFTLERDVAAGLAALARERGVRVASAYLAALAVFLERHSGQSDLLIATWTATDGERGLEAVVGVPGAFTPVRVRVSGAQPFVDLAGDVDRTLTAAVAQEPLPTAELFGDADGSAGVGVAFGWIDGEGAGGPEALALPPRTSLALVVHEHPDGASLTLLHDPASFGLESMARFEARLKVLLASVAAEPRGPLSARALLPAAEEEQLRAWNGTAADYPRDVWVHDLVAAHARTAPDAVAVVDERTQLTYGELDARAERLGGRLRDAGVTSETRVAVALPRSVEMVVALLGIQKSGAAYVPVDVSLPRERVRMMFEDAGVTHVVVDGAGLALLPETAAKVVRGDVDEAPSALASEWPGPARRPRGEALAYVIFTSGSTGRPKGVAVSHGALLNFLSSMQREPGIAAHDVMLAVTTLSFDISGLELYLPLVAGARVVLASREAAQDGRRLMELLTSQGVTIMQATPTTYRLLLGTGWQGAPSFKALIGGEAVPADVAADLVPRCASVWNMYGPTETTIWSTCARLDGTKVVIGKPIANTQVFVLGPALERMPIGVKGELFIGGDGLARGYLDQPGLTSERFLPNPFLEEGPSRLYRTGDVARMLPDGNLECLGRVDSQIKLRGFRIELGEIEHALTKIRAVKAGVVLLRDDGRPGGPRLVAYVVGRSRTTPLSTAELAETLKTELPVYMVPSVFVVVDVLPLNTSGKVDRKALLAIDLGEHAPAQAEYEVPSGDLESVISALWSEALGIPKVGRNDNFFDLGGHSLLALQVHGKLVQKLGKDFPILNLFSYTTVASLAAYLSGMDSTESAVAAETRDNQLERGVERLAQRRNRRRR